MSGPTPSAEPLISIVIPTRERAAKLEYTLKTVMSQPGDRFEVIVSDNASEDETRAVVEKFENDTRLRYVNTGRRLSMCDNWEFAVGQARGRYVMVIGDDDALGVDAYATWMTLIEREPSAIYYWDPHIYHWPVGERGARLVYYSKPSSTRIVRLGDLTRFSFRWGGLRYQRLPLLYHSLVHRDLLERIRRQAGRVFHSTQPDVFLAFALPVFTETALRVGRALTTYGASEYPTPAEPSSQARDAFAEKVRRFVAEYGDYQLHPTLFPGVPFWVNMIPDAMLVARDLFPDYYRSRPFDYDAMWAFLRRYWRFDSVFGIAARRREIRAYHPFHVGRYLFFAAANSLSEVRMAARRVVRPDPAANPIERWPDDIAQFVIRVHAMEEQRVA